MKKLILLYFLFLSNGSIAQLTITGKVINKNTSEAVTGANVFVSNTSYKTVTNAEGVFVLSNINVQKGELVVNALGYNHSTFDINSKTEKGITISLQQVPKELDAVLVKNYDKNGYSKWGRLFNEGFIGSNHSTIDCFIKNTESLKFYYNKKNHQLSVSASEPLKIINKALGYQIDYTLETFEYDTKSNILFFSGYPVFTEMQKGKRKMKQWLLKRNDSYLGSVMHFMRALYSNKLSEEGFIIQKATKKINIQKAAYKKLIAANIEEQRKTNPNAIIRIPLPATEADAELLNQQDSIFEIISQKLPTDSFAFAIDSVTAGMYFEKYLLISFKKAHENTLVSSFVKLLNPESLMIFQNGSYYNSMNFFTERYWAENEKIAYLLPLNFVVTKILKE